jgi:hypothetical protein
MRRIDRAVVFALVLGLHGAAWVAVRMAARVSGALHEPEVVTAMIALRERPDLKEPPPAQRRLLHKQPPSAVTPIPMPSLTPPNYADLSEQTQPSINWFEETRREAAMAGTQGTLSPSAKHPTPSDFWIELGRTQGAQFLDRQTRWWVNDSCFVSLGDNGPSEELKMNCLMSTPLARGDLFKDLPEYKHTEPH